MHCAMYIRNLCGVMAFQRSVLDWRRQWGQPAMGKSALYYIYMKLISCNCFPEIFARLEEGVGSICHRYMCIVLYISRSASRSAKFGVAVFKASILN